MMRPHTRAGKVARLRAIDPNGSYADSWRLAEGEAPLTDTELDEFLDEFEREEAE